MLDRDASAADHLRARISVLLDAFVVVVYRQFLARPEEVWLLEESVVAARRALGLTAEDDPLRDGRIYARGAVLDARTRISSPRRSRGVVARTGFPDR
ncbi:hypothetical protein SAMN04488564_102738 [Lentzea waywayandensis]|uniref:Uncharacterized protein n=1 Tax=Lentzea waywayandensis TaxID=84724 RepID=A0A1I6DII8_9PSEU|nr:hypothetical protein SAMN04488564_102738 [Lentzea waywayandensis]